MKKKLLLFTLSFLLVFTLSANETYAAIPSDATTEESTYQTGLDYGDATFTVNYPSKIYKGSGFLPFTISVSNNDVTRLTSILVAEYYSATDTYLYRWVEVFDSTGGSLDAGETSSELSIKVDTSQATETIAVGGYRFTYQYTTPETFPVYETRDQEVLNTNTEMLFTIDNNDSTSPVIEGATLIEGDVNIPPTLDSIIAGITATDNVDGDITDRVTIGINYYDETNPEIGNHAIEFKVSDTAGNTTQYWITVRLYDYDKPIIILNGDLTMYVEYGTDFVDPGYSVTDNYDDELYNFKSGIVDDTKLGTYNVTYNAQDSSGNVADSITRTIIIQDTTAPEVVDGTTNITTYNSQSKTLTELLANIQIVDNYDGDISSNYTVTSDNYTANIATPGIYTVGISATDSNGNTMTHTLNITVEQDNAPTFTGSSYLVSLSQVASMTAEEIIALMLGQ